MIAVLFCCAPPLCAEQSDLTDLTIEDLMGIKVTSVSKKEQYLSDSAAAIFVITNDDLKRSGVTNIPDALRMVPGLNVARIDSNKWAVNSRGATSRFADKLLVLLDGRNVYTPSFSGVYWEVQDVMLEDVDRIEVIRGPGATLWGANAMNGVINIITKHAVDTQGGLVNLGVGSEEQAFASVRYGASLGKRTYGRIYTKGFKRDEFVLATGEGAGDDWGMQQAGFRIDSDLNANDNVTLQGDIYQGNINQQLNLVSLTAPYWTEVDDSANVSGGNIITRWQHIFSSTSEFTLQAYYDRTEREEVFEHEKRDSFDLDFQHRFSVGSRHDIVWGAHYNHTRDDFSENFIGSLDPNNRSDDLYSVFLQDEILIVQDCLWLTLGSKFEHNDYTGYEVQPSARLLWAPHPEHKLWTSISRAVRTPSRAEHDARVVNSVTQLPPELGGGPMLITAVGTSNYNSEELMAYELGYRFVPNQDFSMDISTFYNDYDNMRTIEQGTPISHGTYMELPFFFTNGLSGHTRGVELAAAWQAEKRLKMDLACSYLVMDIGNGSNSTVTAPRYQVSLCSTVKLMNELDLNIWLRYIDNASNIYIGSTNQQIDIDDYVTLDLCLTWRPTKEWEFSLVGQNLLESRHMEIVQEVFTQPTQVERGILGKIAYRF